MDAMHAMRSAHSTLVLGTMEDFEIVRLLGCGAFGVVVAVRPCKGHVYDIIPHVLFALKLQNGHPLVDGIKGARDMADLEAEVSDEAYGRALNSCALELRDFFAMS